MIPFQRFRSEAFARALDDVERDLDVPAPEHLRGLITLARALPTPDVRMPPEARDRMRRRLVAMAAVTPHEPPEGARRERSASIGGGWASRRVAVVASFVMVLLTMVGVGSAAGRSLPGDPLYRVKLAAERVQLVTAFGDVAHGQRHFDLASERLVEVQQLLDRQRLRALTPTATQGRPLAAGGQLGSTPPPVWNTLGDMSRHTVAGTKDLMAAWRTSGDHRPLRLITGHAKDQWQGLQATVAELPAGDQQAAAKPLGLLMWVTGRAEQLQTIPKTCDAQCRAGRTTGAGGAAITEDALGLPCVTKCNVEDPVSAVGPPQSASGSQAAWMSATLTSLLAALPPPQASNPVPEPMLSLPAVTVATPTPTLTPGSSSSISPGGTPTTTASTQSTAPPTKAESPTPETSKPPSTTPSVAPPTSPTSPAPPDHTVQPTPTPTTTTSAPTASPSTPVGEATGSPSTAVAPDSSGIAKPSEVPASPVTAVSGGAPAAGDSPHLSDSAQQSDSAPAPKPQVPAQPETQPAQPETSPAHPSTSPSP